MTPIHTVWIPCCSQVAELKKLAQRPGRAWAWCLWECTLKLPEGTKAGGKLHLLCRAVDDNVNAQVGRDLLFYQLLLHMGPSLTANTQMLEVDL